MCKRGEVLYILLIKLLLVDIHLFILCIVITLSTELNLVSVSLVFKFILI